MENPDQISIPEVIEMLQELSAQRRATAEVKTPEQAAAAYLGPRTCVHNAPIQDWCWSCDAEWKGTIQSRVANVEDHLDFALRCLLEITRRAGTPVDLRDSIQQHLDDLHEGIDNA